MQTLANIMRSDRQFDGREWPRKLKVATFVYNTNTNRMTGVSPFEAVFGHEATLPVDMIFPLRLENHIWKDAIIYIKYTCNYPEQNLGCPSYAHSCDIHFLTRAKYRFQPDQVPGNITSPCAHLHIASKKLSLYHSLRACNFPCP